MYYQQYYQNKSEKEIENLIRKEGFEPLKYHDQPGFVYTPHQHPETKLLAFLEGSMHVKVADEELDCSKGDKLVIPGNTTHSAIIGPSGCIFFWSEKLI